MAFVLGTPVLSRKTSASTSAARLPSFEPESCTSRKPVCGICLDESCRSSNSCREARSLRAIGESRRFFAGEPSARFVVSSHVQEFGIEQSLRTFQISMSHEESDGAQKWISRVGSALGIAIASVAMVVPRAHAALPRPSQTRSSTTEFVVEGEDRKGVELSDDLAHIQMARIKGGAVADKPGTKKPRTKGDLWKQEKMAELKAASPTILKVSSVVVVVGGAIYFFNKKQSEKELKKTQAFLQKEMSKDMSPWLRIATATQTKTEKKKSEVKKTTKPEVNTTPKAAVVTVIEEEPAKVVEVEVMDDPLPAALEEQLKSATGDVAEAMSEAEYMKKIQEVMTDLKNSKGATKPDMEELRKAFGLDESEKESLEDAFSRVQSYLEGSISDTDKTKVNLDMARTCALLHAPDLFDVQKDELAGLKSLAGTLGVDLGQVFAWHLFDTDTKERVFAECVEAAILTDGTVNPSKQSSLDRIGREIGLSDAIRESIIKSVGKDVAAANNL